MCCLRTSARCDWSSLPVTVMVDGSIRSSACARRTREVLGCSRDRDSRAGPLTSPAADRLSGRPPRTAQSATRRFQGKRDRTAPRVKARATLLPTCAC